MKSILITSSAVIFVLGFVWLQTPVATAAYTYKNRSLNVRTTAYTHSESDHIIYGRKNAIGTQLKFSQEYTSAASDWSRFPVGTEFRIKGLNRHFVIDDYGSALLGKDTIDLYFTSKSSMNRWGVKHVDIVITKYGDFDKSREILSHRTKYRHCRKMLADIEANGDATSEEIYELVPEISTDIDRDLMAAASIPKGEWGQAPPDILPDIKQPVVEPENEVLLADVRTSLKPKRRIRVFRELLAANVFTGGRVENDEQNGEVIRLRYSEATIPDAYGYPVIRTGTLDGAFRPERRVRKFRPF